MLPLSPPWPIGLELLFVIGCYGSARLRANLEEMDGLQVRTLKESMLNLGSWFWGLEYLKAHMLSWIQLRWFLKYVHSWNVDWVAIVFPVNLRSAMSPPKSSSSALAFSCLSGLWLRLFQLPNTRNIFVIGIHVALRLFGFSSYSWNIQICNLNISYMIK